MSTAVERTRVVVVGHGMAGTRFVQELRAKDPGRRFAITALGAEPDAGYNRVLLSSVLAGTLQPAQVELVPSAWYAAEDVDLRTGVEVAHIDRRHHRVLTTAGDYVGYDHLVLATGSRPWVPPVDGLVTDDDELAGTVAVFRTLQDCRDIMDRLGAVRRAVVLGGGLLGLEAARGLAGRGIDVEVIHPADRLMERQLDAGAGRVLVRTLRDLGVRVRLGAQARRYDDHGDRRALVLEDGTRVAADLVVVACGVRPRTGLARAAGLEVDRAVVVDEQLRSVTDPRIHAIGECAQYDGRVYGLVAPAWEQAAVLADVLTGGDARYAGSQVVTRLKAADVDLAAMGDTDVDDLDDEPEVLRFIDPARGTYQKIVIRDDRVAGAILLGGTETVGAVTQLFDRSSPVPADRRALIFPQVSGVVGGAADPASVPDDHTVCRCNGVSGGGIRAACRDGASSVADVALRTRATTGCGGCLEVVEGIVTAELDSLSLEVSA
ncbi:MAG TPA: FAD-dependent oxidoreductase [Jiangellaceae bacterium]